MVSKQFQSAIIASTLMFSGCATAPNTLSKTSASKDVTAILDSIDSVVSVGATVNVGRQLLISYNGQLDKAQKVRKRINLGVIGTGLYTAIAVGTGAHLHNLVVSTALGNALPLIEPNVQPNGSPESLGSAMVKTSCILRASSQTQNSEILLAVAYVEEFKDRSLLSGMQTKLNAAYNTYNGLIPTVIGAYMSVYIDQVSSSTPVLLDSDAVVKQLTRKSEEEGNADEAVDGVVIAAAAAASIAVAAGGARKAPDEPSITEYTTYIATITTTSKLVSDAVSSCVSG